MDLLAQKKRASWSNEVKKIFIDLCIEEVRLLGGRARANLKQSSWEKIIDGFNEKTGLGYNEKQLKNMWDIMKKQYAAWNKLMSQPGMKLNEHIHTVIMEPEKWEEYLKVICNFKFEN